MAGSYNPATATAKQKHRTVIGGRIGHRIDWLPTVAGQAQLAANRQSTIGSQPTRTAPAMFHLHCTRKLLNRLNQKPVDTTGDAAASTLGNWYATALFWRPQAALFVNEHTLLPVLMPLAPAATLTTRFPASLAAAFRSHGWGDMQIEPEIWHMRECEIAKTTNRSVVGMLNEFTFLAQVWRDQHGALDLHDLSMRLADVPCGPLRYDSPAQRVRALALMG